MRIFKYSLSRQRPLPPLMAAGAACMLFAVLPLAGSAASGERPDAESVVSQAPAPENDLVALTPVAGSNTVDVAVIVTGLFKAKLVWPLGTVHIPLESTDSMTAWLEGVQPMRIDAVFDPQNRTGRIVKLTAVGGNVQVSNALSFDLNLGRYYGIGLGHVGVTASNLECRVETPQTQRQSPPAAAVFATDQHLLTIHQGLLSCFASGLASERLAPFTLAFVKTPLREKLGSDTGTATLSELAVEGATNRYRVLLTAPIRFSCPIPVKAPVNVSVAITGTTCWQGTFRRH